MNQVTICNMAITEAGGKRINVVPEPTGKEEGELCDLYWEPSIKECLADYPWRFAKKWAAFAEISGYTFIDDTYDYAYQIPSDYIRWSDQQNTGPSRIVFERREDVFVTTAEEFNAEYIFYNNDPTKYPIWFTQTLVAKLASRLAPALKKKGYEKIDWEQRYVAVLTYNTIKDSNEDHLTADRQHQHSSANDSWIRSRG